VTPSLHSQDLPAQWLEAVLARGGLSEEIEADLRELVDPTSIDVPTYGHRPATRGSYMAAQPPPPRPARAGGNLERGCGRYRKGRIWPRR
jgi:hypothetical protein